MRLALQRVWALVREVTGDDAYERYLAHWRSHHAVADKARPLDRAAFYREEQRRKWNGVRRCC
jgi:uncharacterized short protein YbdD (DUF466 family)